MGKVIIGIHGLGNKPSGELLSKWWKKSIREGLNAIGKPNYLFRFELVYWADLIYPQPLDPEERDPESPLYIEEVYTPSYASPMQVPSSKMRKKILSYLEKQLDRLFLNEDMSLNFESITDTIIRHYFRDLETYYSESKIIKNGLTYPARELIQERLMAVLKKYRRHDILLIGHSMGSIIAYDVLSQELAGIKVNTFLTVGSPLGFPVIVSRIFAEQKKDHPKITRIAAPESVMKRWLNMSDVEDRISIDHSLADDYTANSRGVRAEDITVFNDYMVNGRRNPHKIFGYLRAREAAQVIDEFWRHGRFKLITRLFDWINRWIYKHLD